MECSVQIDSQEAKIGNRYYNRSERCINRGRVLVKKNHVLCKTVKEINLDLVTPQRAGVILYTVKDGELLFGLGIDTRSRQLTDFGGGVSYRKDLNAIFGALREFDEESLRIIDPLTIDQIIDCPVIYDLHNLIVFVYLGDTNTELLSNLFDVKYQKYIEITNMTPEVSKIVWLREHEFRQSINFGSSMFTRVQNFLRRAGNFFVNL